MRSILISIILITALISCSKGYDPSDYLSVQEQDKLMSKVIRYMAKPPENVTFEERFYKGYDSYYLEQQSRHRLDAYYEKNGVGYFLVSRQAPSLVDKRVATGGKLEMDEEGNLISYEEVFRTWKMVPDTLNRKSILLFDRMVKGETLDPYLTKNSMPDEYIEFPDDHTFFDKDARLWKSK